MIANYHIKKKKVKNKGLNYKEKITILFFAFILVFFILFLSYTNIKMARKRANLKAQIAEIQKEIEELENKNANLKESISEIESGQYFEKAAREQLGMKKPDEEVIVINKEKSSSSEEEKKEKRSFWSPKYWWNLINNDKKKEK